MNYYLAVAGVVASSFVLGYSVGVYRQKRVDTPRKVTESVAPTREFRHSDVNRPTHTPREDFKTPEKTALKEPPERETEQDDRNYAALSRTNKKVDNPEVFVEIDNIDEEDLGVRLEYLEEEEWDRHPKGYGVLRLTYFQPDSIISDNFGSILKEPLHSKLIGDTIEQFEIGRFDELGVAYIRNNEVEKDLEVTFTLDTYKTHHGGGDE